MKTLTWAEWKAKHDDFKTLHADGSMTCLDMDADTGETISVFVKIVGLTDANRAEILFLRLGVTRARYPHHVSVDECQPDGGHTECDKCCYGIDAYTIDSAPCLDCWNGGGHSDLCYWQPKDA